MESKAIKNTKKWNALYGSIAVFFSFTCIFYICISSYLTGLKDFWFSLKDFILPLSVVSVLAVSLVYILCVWKPKFFAPLFFGVSFCAYLQLNFLNADYGLIDGHSIEWSSYGLYGALNLCVWIFIIVALIYLYNRSSIHKKIFLYASLLFCAMQFAGLIGEYILAPQKSQDEKQFVLTDAGINEIGDKNNLVMIVLDTFDVRHAKYLLDTNHPVCKDLDGFTFYENAVSPYPKTLTSVPFMLTASFYRNEVGYENFLKEQYKNSELINQLYENNYDIRLYTDTSESMSVLKNKVKNLKNTEDPQSSSPGWKIWKQLMRYGLFREIPHSLKKHVPISINDFNNLKEFSDETPSEYITNDSAYYQRLKRNGIAVNTESSAFRLIHLNGMHEPLTLASDASQVSQSTVYNQLDGTMVILSEYLNALRTAGVYDDTAIMVLGDHGAILGNQPALFFKPIGSKGGLQVSDTAVYYEDIHKTLLNEVGLDVSYGENMTILSATTRERMYYDYRIDDLAPNDFFPNMWEAIYTDNNVSCQFTGNIYHPQEKTSYLEYAKSLKALKLGSQVTLEEMRKYFNSNFLTWGEDDYIWSIGLESIMLFRLDKVPDLDVSITLNFLPWIDSEHKSLVVTLMDGTPIYEQTYYMGKSEPNFTFTIPAIAFDRNGAIALKMLWSDDSSALTKENSDLRAKQVALKSFQVHK